MKKSFVLLVVILFTAVLRGGVIQETIEAAAKVSGKALSSSSGKAAGKILTKVVQKYGDDALKVVKNGGIEAIKQGRKYGDDFWKLAKHASPQTARSLALHADELMPIAKRIGPQFIHLENKIPGLASKVATEFGDDAVRYLAKNASPNDVSKLLGFAGRADSPATKKLLFESYRKGGTSILKKLDTKKILALGLTASMITAAYKVSDGIETGIEQVAKSNPETFQNVVGNIVLPFQILVGILVVLFAWPLLKLWRRLCRSGKSQTNSKDVDTNSEQNSWSTND